MDKHACQVHQRQNKMTNSNRKDYSQCRPEYQLINRRYEKAGLIIYQRPIMNSEKVHLSYLTQKGTVSLSTMFCRM